MSGVCGNSALHRALTARRHEPGRHEVIGRRLRRPCGGRRSRLCLRPGALGAEAARPVGRLVGAVGRVERVVGAFASLHITLVRNRRRGCSGRRGRRRGSSGGRFLLRLFAIWSGGRRRWGRSGRGSGRRRCGGSRRSSRRVRLCLLALRAAAALPALPARRSAKGWLAAVWGSAPARQPQARARSLLPILAASPWCTTAAGRTR